MIKNILLAITTICLFVSCDKKDGNDNSKITMGDIHLTDANGAPIGGGSDSDEWQLGSEIENELEDFFTGNNELCNSINSNKIFPAYPNPAIDVMQLSFALEGEYELDLIIVDNCYEPVLALTDLLFASSDINTISMNLSTVPTDKTYRLFYRFTLPDCIYSGYGDIRKE